MTIVLHVMTCEIYGTHRASRLETFRRLPQNNQITFLQTDIGFGNCKFSKITAEKEKVQVAIYFDLIDMAHPQKKGCQGERCDTQTHSDDIWVELAANGHVRAGVLTSQPPPPSRREGERQREGGQRERERERERERKGKRERERERKRERK